jgi:hypothetical protein
MGHHIFKLSLTIEGGTKQGLNKMTIDKMFVD